MCRTARHHARHNLPTCQAICYNSIVAALAVKMLTGQPNLHENINYRHEKTEGVKGLRVSSPRMNPVSSLFLYCLLALIAVSGVFFV